MGFLMPIPKCELDLYSLVDNFPNGKSDKEMLNALLIELIIKMDNSNKLNFEFDDFLSLRRRDVLKIGSFFNKKRRMSSKIEDYGYDDFFAPELYKAVYRFESTMIEVNKYVKVFENALLEDGDEYILSTLERCFDNNIDTISRKMGVKITSKDDLFKAKESYKTFIFNDLKLHYEKLRSGFKLLLGQGKIHFSHIYKFKQIKMEMEQKIIDGDFLKSENSARLIR
jgi:hypothetical protein